MNPWRVVLAFIFPPLAVLDKGCGTASLVFVLTMLGWIPGVILALVLISSESSLSRRSVSDGDRRFVEIPVQDSDEKLKRKGAFIRLEDGEVAQVIEDDGTMPEKRKRLE